MKKNILILSILSIISTLMFSSCFFDGHNYTASAIVGSYKLLKRENASAGIDINDVYYLYRDGSFKYSESYAVRGYYILKPNNKLFIVAAGTSDESAAPHGEWNYNNGYLTFNNSLKFIKIR